MRLMSTTLPVPTLDIMKEDMFQEDWAMVDIDPILFGRYLTMKELYSWMTKTRIENMEQTKGLA